MHDSNSLACGGVSGHLPLTTNFGKKSCPRRALFSQHLTAAITVVTDRGCADKNLWRAFQSRNRFRNQRRAFHSALQDALLARGSPSSTGDILTGKMDDGIDSTERRNIHSALLRIPVGGPFQSNNFISCGRKERDESRSDKSS